MSNGHTRIALLALLLFALPVSADWKNGPLPPGTRGWGAVVPRGYMNGWLYCRFDGDCARVSPDSANPAILFPFVLTIQPNDIERYNCSIDWPPGPPPTLTIGQQFDIADKWLKRVIGWCKAAQQ